MYEMARDNQGLFVYTTQASDSVTAYYAITTVRNGSEIVSSLQLSQVVSESVNNPVDVLTASINGGNGRIYTQYMDYSQWNPTFNGYAYNYSVALPSNYNPSQSYPLLLRPHAYGEGLTYIGQAEFGWQLIELFLHDPGTAQGSIHSWWYGYAAQHNYLTDGRISTAGTIENFTEQRVMRAIDAMIADRAFNIDEDLIHAYGNSMGASGSLSWAMRYPSVISGVYANQPMTDYRDNPLFAQELERAWGLKSNNLPIVNDGPRSGDIRTYGQQGFRAVGVWDWMDHHQQLVARRGDDFAYLMTLHGKNDNIIDWRTQGVPTVQAFTNANVGFSAMYNDSGHAWNGFAAVVTKMFGLGGGSFEWKYPLDLSFPAIQNASGSSAVSPSASGTNSYNLNIEWATAHNPFDDVIVDLPNRYEITLKSNAGTQTADITPRRTQRFTVNANTFCSWTTTRADSGARLASGTVRADSDALVTVNRVQILNGSGTRLAINCP